MTVIWRSYLRCLQVTLILILTWNCGICSHFQDSSINNDPLEEMEQKSSQVSAERVPFEVEEILINSELDGRVRHRRSSHNNVDRNMKRNKSKKREGRKKIAINLVEKIVEDKLKEQLAPLATALRIVRLDGFSEGMLRHLTNMEHIQSRLLTEFGELRAAVNEVGRHTLDLGRQVAGLDEQINTLGRQLRPSRSDLSGYSRSDFRFDNGVRPSSHHISYSSAEILKEVLLSINTKISGSERRLKADLVTIGNRTLEAVKSSKSFLERRIAEVALDAERLLTTVEKIGNESHCATSFATPSTRTLHTDKMFRRPSSFSQHSYHKLSFPEGVRDDLVYFPAEKQSIKRAERQHPPSITPFTSWMSTDNEDQSMSAGTINKLAAEIAKQIGTQGVYPKDCLDIATKGEMRSGVYTIYPASCSSRFVIKVWCELETSSGGWTVIQNRGTSPPSVGMPQTLNFFRNWIDYKWGFGDLKQEYWLGNEYIHQMTESGDYDLRIELQDWSSEARWAEYSHFYIDDEKDNYTLHFGEYTGNAGNSLKHHQGASFSTKDRDNDSNPKGHCARTFHGAWWFTSCHESHLNGHYHRGRHKSYGEGINWLAFRGHNYSLKKSRMMIRPSFKNS